LSVDVEYFEHHYDTRHEELADRMWEVTDHLRAKCPVTHSDAPTESGRPGFWLLTSYEDVFAVLQDWRTFSQDSAVRAKYDTAAVYPGSHMPPITLDPPLQGDFRRLLNPFLSPQAVAAYEPGSRAIVTELLDDFIEDEVFS